jgi:hypothetical protein
MSVKANCARVSSVCSRIDINHEIISPYFIQLKSSILDDWNDDDVFGAAFPNTVRLKEYVVRF